ncbi:hypothetical protein Q5741_15230 [Paenibacillus sp. JX-17]|uniref:SGNH/GDSL hydrolase family protein n=1 Tax=Paenibacillus lacisoli TaxID=3064525 RepID=A0ABT9CGQ3_9BACL|nr:hypothetical protein [Paenibacillus sp. JX-17]MDO7907763.1 hypothetical protein [Paenibacillus sp. JX-17]
MIYETETLFNVEIKLAKIEKVMRTSVSILEENLFSEAVTSNINVMIDELVKFNQELEPILTMHPSEVVIQNIYKVFDLFEFLISAYNCNNDKEIIEIYGQLLYHYKILRQNFNAYSYQVSGTKKVIVVGVNLLSSNLNSYINPRNRKILAYISEQNELTGKYLAGIPILEFEDVSYLSYEYLIITDNYKIESMQDDIKMLNLYEFVSNHYDFELYRAYNSLYGKQKQIDSFITGISYTEVGIDVNELPYQTLNLAVSSQDLFYDFQWAEEIVSYHKKGKPIKWAIIGLSYYSLEYDLSRSKFKNRAYYYYPFFKTISNLEDKENKIQKYNEFEALAAELFVEPYLLRIFDTLKSMAESKWETLTNGIMNEEHRNSGRQEAERDGNKDYPETVGDNKKILKKYINMLIENNIKPIVVICPVSRYYHPYFPSRIKRDFDNYMEDMRNEFDIDILNYFESEWFTDQDFYDSTHLNKAGARKLTKMLKRHLEQSSLDGTK